MTVVENDTQFMRSADLMGRYRLHLTSNASPGCVGSLVEAGRGMLRMIKTEKTLIRIV